jgi:hypothetical protein
MESRGIGAREMKCGFDYVAAAFRPAAFGSLVCLFVSNAGAETDAALKGAAT